MDADLKNQNNEAGRIKPGLVVALLFLTVIYRVAAPSFHIAVNTAPVMAVCFGGALLLGLRFWWIPILLLLVSDGILGLTHEGGGIGKYTLMSAAYYSLVAWVGSRAGRWSGKIWPMMWCGTLIASTGFYLFANTFAWVVSPEYMKTFAGWWQSQTVGLPQFSPPSWVFLRNAIIADTIWCALAGVIFFGKTLPLTVSEKTGSSSFPLPEGRKSD